MCGGPTPPGRSRRAERPQRPAVRAYAAVTPRAVRSFAVMPTTSTDEALAGLRAAVDDALAKGNRALAGVRAQYRNERAHLRAPAVVIARWANTPLDLEKFSEDAEGDAALRSIVVSLARDTGILRSGGATQSRTRGERIAGIGTAWAAAGAAGAVDGLFGSQLPSLVGTIGLYFGSHWADGEYATALLQAYRGVAATTLYTAVRDVTAATRPPSQSAEAP